MDRIISYAFLGLLLIFCFSTREVIAITQSSTVSIGATVGSVPTLEGGGGGGAGTGSESGVKFSGVAYPGAVVVVQKGTVVLVRTTADSIGAFTVMVSEAADQLFTLVATDADGRRSVPLNFPTVFYSGRLTDISGIRFAPTIATDKLSVKQGDYLTISGMAVPLLPLQVTLRGGESRTFTLTASASGRYSMTVPLMVSLGNYILTTGYDDDARTSKAVSVIVGAENIYQVEATTNIPGDYNLDQKVTILDFSVLAYWFGRKNPPVTVDINKDGSISLVDFSIMAFYWNG